MGGLGFSFTTETKSEPDLENGIGAWNGRSGGSRLHKNEQRTKKVDKFNLVGQERSPCNDY
jgi:hypothetical protein